MNWDILYDFLIDGKAGKKIFKDIAGGKYGRVYTTDHILTKVMSVLTAFQREEKVGPLLTSLYGGIEEKPQLTDRIIVLRVQKSHSEEARRWFFKYQVAIGLDLVDWFTVSLMRHKKDLELLTFDINFDALGDLGDETLPKVIRIALKKPRQLVKPKTLFIVGLASLILIPLLALVAGNLNITLPDAAYYALAVITIVLVGASAFGRRVVTTFLRKSSR